MQPPLQNLKSMRQLFSLFLFALLPLIVFYFVEATYGLKAGVIAAIIFGILEVSFEYLKTKKFDLMTISSTLLVIILGLISIYLENDAFIKIKPAILEMVFAIIFLSALFTKTPIMIIMAEKQFKLTIERTSFQFKYMKAMNIRMGLFFLVHTILTVYSALYMSTGAWMFIKGVLFNVMLGAFFVFEYFYGKYSANKYLINMQLNQTAFKYIKKI